MTFFSFGRSITKGPGRDKYPCQTMLNWRKSREAWSSLSKLPIQILSWHPVHLVLKSRFWRSIAKHAGTLQLDYRVLKVDMCFVQGKNCSQCQRNAGGSWRAGTGERVQPGWAYCRRHQRWGLWWWQHWVYPWKWWRCDCLPKWPCPRQQGKENASIWIKVLTSRNYIFCLSYFNVLTGLNVGIWDKPSILVTDNTTWFSALMSTQTSTTTGSTSKCPTWLPESISHTCSTLLTMKRPTLNWISVFWQ